MLGGGPRGGESARSWGNSIAKAFLGIVRTYWKEEDEPGRVWEKLRGGINWGWWCQGSSLDLADMKAAVGSGG